MHYVNNHNVSTLFTSHHSCFFLSALQQVMALQFQALDCTTLKDGSRWLRADTSVDCDSDEFNNFVVLNSFLIVAYQCIPLAFLAMLWRLRDRIQPRAANKRAVLPLTT